MDVPNIEPKSWPQLTKELLVNQLKKINANDIENFEINIIECVDQTKIEMCFTIKKIEE